MLLFIELIYLTAIYCGYLFLNVKFLMPHVLTMEDSIEIYYNGI